MKIHLGGDRILDFDHHTVRSDGARISITGESGSGKSHVAANIIGQVLEQKGQVCITDMHGEYGPLAVLSKNAVLIGYGTKNSMDLDVALLPEYEKLFASGKSLFFNLVEWTDIHPELLNVFLGGAKDAVLSVNALKALETALASYADNGEPEIVIAAAERLISRYRNNPNAEGLLQRIYRVSRAAPKLRFMLYEEAQNVAPQAKADLDTLKTRITIGMLTGGRKFGLNGILCTQRPALVDKSALSACNVRIIMRLSEIVDWNRMEEYIPPGVKVTYDGKGTGIKYFASGEAIVTGRLIKEGRIHLSLPTVAPGSHVPGVIA